MPGLSRTGPRGRGVEADGVEQIASPVRRRDLDEPEDRVVRPFPEEFCVKGDDRLAKKPVADGGEFLPGGDEVGHGLAAKSDSAGVNPAS